VGRLIVFVGVALLLDHMGIVSIGGLWRFWADDSGAGRDCKHFGMKPADVGRDPVGAGILLQLGEFNLVRVTWALLCAGGGDQRWADADAGIDQGAKRRRWARESRRRRLE